MQNAECRTKKIAAVLLNSEFCVLHSVYDSRRVRLPSSDVLVLRRDRRAGLRGRGLEPAVVCAGLPGLLPAVAGRPGSRSRRRLERHAADYGRVAVASRLETRVG